MALVVGGNKESKTIFREFAGDRKDYLRLIEKRKRKST